MIQTRRTLQDHLPQLKTVPSTLGAAIPGDFVPKMEPPALNAGSTFFTWALFRVILSAPMPHRFYSPSPEATFRNPPSHGTWVCLWPILCSTSLGWSIKKQGQSHLLLISLKQNPISRA